MPHSLDIAERPPREPSGNTAVLGIEFSCDPCQHFVALVVRQGGLLVVPSGPGLATLDTDRAYRDALLAADHAIVDSGYLALLWRFLGHGKLVRVSGLAFIDALLNEAALREPCSSYWLMPRAEEWQTTRAYLSSRGIDVPESHAGIAPVYPSTGPVEDPELLATLNRLKPAFVILNIAGGKQEKLGHYLQQHLPYKPALICTGAAIAFLTGHQARIPKWADRLYLGWLWRCFEKPDVYIPRYLSAVRLAYLVARYGAQLPPMKPRAEAE